MFCFQDFSDYFVRIIVIEIKTENRRFIIIFWKCVGPSMFHGLSAFVSKKFPREIVAHFEVVPDWERNGIWLEYVEIGQIETSIIAVLEG